MKTSAASESTAASPSAVGPASPEALTDACRAAYAALEAELDVLQGDALDARLDALTQRFGGTFAQRTDPELVACRAGLARSIASAARSWLAEITSQAPSAALDGDGAAPIHRERRSLLAWLAHHDTDGEHLALRLVEGVVLVRDGRPGEAVAPLLAVVDGWPRDDVGAYAADVLLQALARAERFDELKAQLDRLAEDPRLIEAHGDWAERVARARYALGRRAAEELLRDGRHRECGEAYLAVYNENPGADKSDEVLYNAGVCFETARSAGAAITIYRSLVSRFPRSRLSAMARRRLAAQYVSVAWYHKAAEELETYARLYPGERDARDALSAAFGYWLALGDRDAAKRDAERFHKLYGSRYPREAAEAMFALALAYRRDGDAALIRHAQRYLSAFGARGGRARQIAVHAMLGEALWAKSCPVTATDGLCAKIARIRGPRCGDVAEPERIAVRRREPAVREARAAFERALALWRGLPRGDAERAMAARWAAAARFYLAADAHEQALAVTPPARMGARAPAAAIAQIESWQVQRSAAMAGALADYTALARDRDAGPWATAAAARIASIYGEFAAALATPRGRDRDGYCRAVGPTLDASRRGQREALVMCVELGWTRARSRPWLARCVDALVRADPQTFPAQREIAGARVGPPDSLRTLSPPALSAPPPASDASSGAASGSEPSPK